MWVWSIILDIEQISFEDPPPPPENMMKVLTYNNLGSFLVLQFSEKETRLLVRRQGCIQYFPEKMSLVKEGAKIKMGRMLKMMRRGELSPGYNLKMLHFVIKIYLISRPPPPTPPRIFNKTQAPSVIFRLYWTFIETRPCKPRMCSYNYQTIPVPITDAEASINTKLIKPVGTHK